MLDHSVEQEMCPIALASHLLGDKWIPIIIRDIALFDRRTFNDLLKNNLEKISSGSLTSRLQRLVHLEMLEVTGDDTHSQKRIYSLTESGIGFVPVVFKMAGWTAEFRNPSPVVVAMSQPYIDGDAVAIDSFLRTLRDIHIHKTAVPEPLWWKS